MAITGSVDNIRNLGSSWQQEGYAAFPKYKQSLSVEDRVQHFMGVYDSTAIFGKIYTYLCI